MNSYLGFIILFKYLIYLFLERGREGKREGEKHQCAVASHMHSTRDPWLSGLSAGLQTKGSLVQFPVRAHTWVMVQVPD